jgi:hypothetical protein
LGPEFRTYLQRLEENRCLPNPSRTRADSEGTPKSPEEIADAAVRKAELDLEDDVVYTLRSFTYAVSEPEFVGKFPVHTRQFFIGKK